jgi:hypothetical protein
MSVSKSFSIVRTQNYKQWIRPLRNSTWIIKNKGQYSSISLSSLFSIWNSTNMNTFFARRMDKSKSEKKITTFCISALETKEWETFSKLSFNTSVIIWLNLLPRGERERERDCYLCDIVGLIVHLAYQIKENRWNNTIVK